MGLAIGLDGEVRFYAGGTEILLVLREGLLQADHLIDLKTVPELSQLEMHPDGSLVIGAAVTHTDIERSPLVADAFPQLVALERNVANVRVRNTGTIGGNLCFGEPHGDPAALLIAADAQVILQGKAGVRAVPLVDWIQGPFQVDLAPGELLVKIRIPRSESAFAYRRFRALERPTASAAVRLDLGANDGVVEDVRIVIGCVGPSPIRARAAEARVRGVLLEDVLGFLGPAGDDAAASVDVFDDAYGPVDHKRHLVGVLTQRALQAALVDAVAIFRQRSAKS